MTSTVSGLSSFMKVPRRGCGCRGFVVEQTAAQRIPTIWQPRRSTASGPGDSPEWLGLGGADAELVDAVPDSARVLALAIGVEEARKLGIGFEGAVPGRERRSRQLLALRRLLSSATSV